MIMKNIKISHKIIFMTGLGLLLISSLGAWIVIAGKGEISMLNDIYEHKMKPLDNLRQIQRAFREIEFRMTGVISDMAAPLGAASYLKTSIKEIDMFWDKTKAEIQLEEEKSNFEKGFKTFKRISMDLNAAYLDEDIDRVTEIYEDDWLDVKPMLIKTIDKMAGSMDEATMSFFIEEESSINRINSVVIVVCIVSAAVFVFCGFLIARSISRPLEVMVKKVKDVAAGDFTHTIDLGSTDEMGMIAGELDRMLSGLREAFSRIAGETDTVSFQAEKLSESSNSLLKGVEQQKLQVEQVATSATEMSQTVVDVASNAMNANELTMESANFAKTGKNTVIQTVDSITKLAESVEAAAKSIKELGKSSQEIGVIVSVIQDIADQTNLLALNAAIEAARAGEQGRGFAVVADEVRKLAEKTAKATSEISEKINGIQAKTRDSISAMEKGSSLTDEAVGNARKAGESLEKIVESSQKVTQTVQSIATATEEQSAAADEVSHNMEEVSGVINETASSSEEVRASSSELLSVAQGLISEMRRFKI